MREIVLDTETTGFDPQDGHRIVEIGCLELFNQIPTGETYHQYINPQRDMPTEAFDVHGLGTEFLSTQPVFTEIVGDFIDFIGDARLIIHNAEFDMRFINAELELAGFKPLPMSQALDTLAVARQRFPGSPASLDALCRRFEIDNSNRTLHGALLDSELLAEVYLHLLGGRQHGLTLDDSMGSGPRDSAVKVEIKAQKRAYRSFDVPVAEAAAHKEMLADITDPIWTDIDDKPVKAD
ncbi:MAG: DNA polymerase III subunit epsilon [Pseudomonadota bacterium]